MGKLLIPEHYTPVIDYMESQRAIKKIKDFFQQELAYGLQLRRVSAPLFVAPETGLNDNLNGVERTVSFTVKDMGEKQVEIVQSLAKWKRMALGKYNFKPGTGLYTDMNAIRRDEELDNLHSIYVDQWDWEKVITKADRTEKYLEETVTTLYNALKNLNDYVNRLYRNLPQICRTRSSSSRLRNWKTCIRTRRRRNGKTLLLRKRRLSSSRRSAVC